MAGGVTRRSLIGGAAGAAIAGTAEARRGNRALPSPSGPRRPKRADVIVIGAGLAGLTAARDIVKKGKSVIVLEARDRVGGRTLNQPIGGGKVIEIGGQWIGPTQDALAKLAKSVGVKTYKTYNEGNNVYYRNGSAQTYSSSGPLGPVPPDLEGAVDAEAAIVKLDDMATHVPRDKPWTADSAVEWDGQSVETWKNNNVQTPGGRFLLDVGVEAVWAAEPRDLSLLYMLFYIAGAGNESNPGTFERLINTGGGAQESRFVGGSQLISLKMAKKLGRRVALDAPARRIVTSGNRVKVHCDGGYTVTGKRVIVAMAPALAGRIEYEPALPALRDQLGQKVPNGSVIKCEAVYAKPFWRDAGLTGQAVSDSSPVRITFDNTPPDGTPGVMLGFIEGHAARVYGRMSAKARRKAVLDNFASYFGEQARKPKAYYEKDWSKEEWTRGCYTGYMGPGVLLDHGPALRKPVGRVHWAGTETSEIWAGYMDGAVRSGHRAAKEVLAHI